MPTRFEVAKENPIFQAILVRLDPDNGHALSVERITLRGEK